MSDPTSFTPPGSARLVQSTLLSIAVASVILVTTVLPAEYGIDPTGTGARLGLDALKPSDTGADTAPATAARPASLALGDAATSALAAKAEAAFGAHAGQSLDVRAFSASLGTPRNETLSLTLEPGKGAEVKAALKAGEGLVFHWTASAEVAVDMHGEVPDAKGTWTSYSVESAQREAAGTFVAPFEGTHGWYWQNRGNSPVTVEIAVTGFQPALYRP